MRESDEEIYIRFLREENEEDLRELLERHRERLTLFINGYIHSMDDAEELMIDCFAVIASKTARYTVMRHSSFKTWLFAIGRNRAHTWLRKNRMRPEELREDLPDGENTPLAAVLKEEEKQLLYRGLMAISPKYRQVLYLLYFEEMDYPSVGRILGKSVKQVYNLADRGKRSLRDTLEGMGFQWQK